MGGFVVNKSVVVALGLLGPGIAVAAPPAWCKDAKFGETSDLGDLKASEPDRVDYAIKTVVKATCKPEASIANRAGDVEKRRQQLSGELGMTDADWADAVAFTNADGASDEIAVSTKDFATMTPLDQYQVIWEGLSTAGGNRFDDFNYLADAFEPSLTEVGKLAYIKKCIANKSTSSTDDAVQFAMCQADIDGLDLAKFGAQLRGDTAHNAAQRMHVRISLYGVKTE
ncbi:MAG TPA: hypothetical protein VLB44_01905, partial [Kofleriaceae bacterium]|nr:hypothetical protein [Kofleriaceae bacterium]